MSASTSTSVIPRAMPVIRGVVGGRGRGIGIVRRRWGDGDWTTRRRGRASRARDGGWENDSEIVDAIVVVAGGIEADGTLPPWVTPRLDRARERFEATGGRVKILVSGSMTPHKPPPMGPGGFNVHESTSMASYLMERGVPATAVLKDTASMDTIGNAYYSLCLHAIPLGWKRVEVVTSAFHMARTRAAFEWVWGLTPHGEVDMRFVSTEDAGISETTLRARAEREAESAAALRANAAKITTLADFNEWLFTTHKCYAAARQHEIGVFDEVSSEAMKSY